MSWFVIIPGAIMCFVLVIVFASNTYLELASRNVREQRSRRLPLAVDPGERLPLQLVQR